MRISPYILVLAVVPATALAGPVKGKIAGADKLLPEVYQEASKDSHRYTWREPSLTVKQEFRALSANPSHDICIAAISPGQAQKHDPIGILLTGGNTIPSTIVISPGTQITFINHDPFPHKMFQVGNDAFKPDEIGPGGKKDWTSPGAGRYEFRDQLFPSVRFFVVVDPGVVEVTYPAHNGTFAFKDLPPGDYYLQAYVDGKPVGKKLTVVANKGTVDVKEALVVAEGSDAK